MGTSSSIYAVTSPAARPVTATGGGILSVEFNVPPPQQQLQQQQQQQQQQPLAVFTAGSRVSGTVTIYFPTPVLVGELYAEVRGLERATVALLSKPSSAPPSNYFTFYSTKVPLAPSAELGSHASSLEHSVVQGTFACGFQFGLPPSSSSSCFPTVKVSGRKRMGASSHCEEIQGEISYTLRVVCRVVEKRPDPSHLTPEVLVETQTLTFVKPFGVQEPAIPLPQLLATQQKLSQPCTKYTVLPIKHWLTCFRSPASVEVRVHLPTDVITASPAGGVLPVSLTVWNRSQLPLPPVTFTLEECVFVRLNESGFQFEGVTTVLEEMIPDVVEPEQRKEFHVELKLPSSAQCHADFRSGPAPSGAYALGEPAEEEGDLVCDQGDASGLPPSPSSSSSSYKRCHLTKALPVSTGL